MNRCERCGQAVPDGLPVCPECLKAAGAGNASVGGGGIAGHSSEFVH